MLFGNKLVLKDHPISTFEDYIDLPKALRESKHGLYLVPRVLKFDLDSRVSEWDKFYNFVKKEYVIQWFIRHWLFSLDNPIYKAHNILNHYYLNSKYAIKRFFNPLFPRWRKCAPRCCYTDITELVVKSNFALILDFWYEEVAKDIINWNDNEKHKAFYKELKTAVKYIEESRQKLHDKAEIELEKASKLKKKNISYEQKYGKYNAVEQLIEAQDTHILSWFIENRGYFWT